MKTSKKVYSAFDRRQKDYNATVDRLQRNNKYGARGYKKPGSSNPRKHGA